MSLGYFFCSSVPFSGESGVGGWFVDPGPVATSSKNRPGRMPGQPAAFPELAVLGQNPVGRGDRRQIHALVQQLGANLHQWQVNEPGRVHRRQDSRPLEDAKLVRRDGPGGQGNMVASFRVAVARATPASAAAEQVDIPRRSAHGTWSLRLRVRGFIPRAVRKIFQELVHF